MMRKSMCGIAVGVLIATVFTGCGGDSSQNGKAENGEKEQVRITYSVGELDGQSKDLDNALANFYAEHPNCEVVLEENGTALMAKIAANDSPDIIRVSAVTDLPTFVNKNIIMPLDDLLAESELYEESDIYPICIDSFRYDGKEFGKGNIYGLPKDWAPDGLWVNKTMLTAAELTIPTMDRPLTYDQLAEYAKKLTQKEGNNISVFGMIDATGGVHKNVETMLNLQDKSMWSNDFKRVDLHNEAVKNAFRYFYELKMGGYTQSAIHPIDGNGNPEFSKGMAAMNVSSLYSGNVYTRNEERTVDFDEIELVPPAVANGTNRVVTTCSPTGAVISASTKNPDLAFDLWEYIHLGELVEKRALTGLNLPIKRSVAENVKLEDAFLNRSYLFSRQLAEEEYTFVRTNPYVTNTSVSGVMEKYFTPLLYGQYEFDEALELMESELQLLIDEGVANQ